MAFLYQEFLFSCFFLHMPNCFVIIHLDFKQTYYQVTNILYIPSQFIIIYLDLFTYLTK